MCPDRDLVSAYVDGEVPSPWRERIDEHLASCRDCAALASSYSALGERLRIELVENEAESLARGRAKLDVLLGGLSAADEGAHSSARGRGESWKDWRRPVSLPLPLAAAAVLLVILLGGATTLLALRPSKTAAIQAVASGVIAPSTPEARAQPASMDELLRYLDAQGGQVTLTIKLPNDTTFGSAGQPVIMRSGQVVSAARGSM